MKFKICLAISIIAVTGTSTCSTVAQDSFGSFGSNPPNETSEATRSGFDDNRLDRRSVQPANRSPTTLAQVQTAELQLTRATTDEQKKAAKQELEKALNAHFDVDVANRQKELDAIKERMKKMEELLKQRIESKQEIVALRIQVLTNQANGLGWLQSQQTGQFNYGAPPYSQPNYSYSYPQNQATFPNAYRDSERDSLDNFRRQNDQTNPSVDRVVN